MMKGMPGWGPDDEVKENQKRGKDVTGMALDALHKTVLVTDDDDDVVRVISLDTQATVATIALPDDSEAHAIAVNSIYTLAAVVLSNKGSVAIIDLTTNKVLSVVPTGTYPSHAVFSGFSLLVTNSGNGSLSVIDTNTRLVTKTVMVGYGASGIAVSGNTAAIANMQAGSVALVDLTTWAVQLLPLPAGVRPHEVAIANGKALFTTPASNALYVLDLTSKQFQQIETGFWNAMGPGAIAVSGNYAFVANQMSSSVTLVDLSTGKPGQTFGVDPGPCALAVWADKGLLLVLSSGTNTIDLVNMTTGAITSRLNAGETSRQDGKWTLPAVTAMTPNTAAVGSAAFTMTLTGSNLQGVKDLEFHQIGMNAGTGMGKGKHGEDDNIQVSKVTVNSDGTQITATVQVLATATAGVRELRLETERGEVPVPSMQFTVSK
jgi:YVTN family beta-propeller protein